MTVVGVTWVPRVTTSPCPPLQPGPPACQHPSRMKAKGARLDLPPFPTLHVANPEGQESYFQHSSDPPEQPEVGRQQEQA